MEPSAAIAITSLTRLVEAHCRSRESLMTTMMVLSAMFGQVLATKCPDLVPLISLIDWVSCMEPEGDPRDFLLFK